MTILRLAGTILRLAGALVLSAGLAGAALAQDADTQNRAGEAAATAQSAPPIGSGAAIEWVGKPLAAIDGTEVGTVSEVVTDEAGAVTEVRARVGGIFGLFARQVSIPAASIILEQNGRLVAEMSAEQIRGSADVRG